MRVVRSTLYVGLILILGSAVVGCSKKKTAAEIPSHEVTATEPAEGSYEFDIPAEFGGGVITVALSNSGDERHDFQLAAVVDGHELQELVDELASDEAPLSDWVAPAGGVGGTAPGATNEATFALPAGDYWYFCTESSDEGASHAANGMAGELTVAGDSGAELPAADATIAASEYTFDITGLAAGTNTIEFSNAGEQLHHVLAVPVLEGKTIEDVAAALAEETPSGPPPLDFEAAQATAVVNPGDRVIVAFEFDAGTTYAFMCFMPDKGTAGPPHAAKGMLVGEDIT